MGSVSSKYVLGGIVRSPEIERRSGVTRYQQVYTLLSRQLSDGTIPPGSAMPTEQDLMKRFNVSRNTVRHALARLERERRVIRRRGSGTYAIQVGAPRPEASSRPIDGLAPATGGCLSARPVSLGRAPTPAYVLERWTTFGPEAVVLSRTWRRADRPVAVSLAYIRVGLAPVLSKTVVAEKSLFEALTETGAKIARVTRRLQAEIADAMLAAQLDLMQGSAVLVETLWAIDPDGQPCACQVITHRGDSFQAQQDWVPGSGERWRPVSEDN